jgi:hypothetical protein
VKVQFAAFGHDCVSGGNIWPPEVASEKSQTTCFLSQVEVPVLLGASGDQRLGPERFLLMTASAFCAVVFGVALELAVAINGLYTQVDFLYHQQVQTL